MYNFDEANPCRPGFGASCSFCCGSHNYKKTREELEEMFMKRGMNNPEDDKTHQEVSLHEKLVEEGLQCCHVGFAESEYGTVGCLVYTEDHSGSDMEEFFTGTCKTYLCEAWKELSDREILFAAELMHDWYYYSILINSPDVIQELCADYGSPDEVPEDVLDNLKFELSERIQEML